MLEIVLIIGSVLLFVIMEALAWHRWRAAPSLAARRIEEEQSRLREVFDEADRRHISVGDVLRERNRKRR